VQFKYLNTSEERAAAGGGVTANGVTFFATHQVTVRNYQSHLCSLQHKELLIMSNTSAPYRVIDVVTVLLVLTGA
jgi:hypothetical protein